MGDSYHLQRLNTLFEKLKVQPTDNVARSKFRHVQGLVNSFTQEVDRICEDKHSKVEHLTERLLKLQTVINEDILRREEKEQLLGAKIIKVEKSCFKLIDTFNKERAEADRRLQSSIEVCLSEINNYKLRTQGECGTSIREIESFIPEIEDMTKEVENEALLTREILKKIHHQFLEQIEELRTIIGEEKVEREAEEEQVVSKLEEVYHGMHKRIATLKSARDKSEKMLVDLLERVIDKVKKEIVGY